MMLPVVDTVEVGSGGGSIARVDPVGSLKVGPVSAGAEPGPACYGKGGMEPTVTDANLVLGRLDPGRFLGGEMPLDVAASHGAIRSRIAAPLGLSEIEAALAVVKIAVINMSLAVRQVSVERGYDPRDFAMVAFGGAGPLHAVEVARSLHIPIVIVPNFPGQFSASGMLMANPRHDFVRTYYRPLGRTDFAELGRIAEELESQARERLREDSPVEMSHFLEIRYSGQDFSLPVQVEPRAYAQDYAATVHAAFNAMHRSKFGYHDGEQSLEVVNAHLVATVKVGRTPWSAAGRPALVRIRSRRSRQTRGSAADYGVRPTFTRPVYLDSAEAPVDCAVYQRESLEPGGRIEGPADIHEYASTTLLFPGDVAQVAESAGTNCPPGRPCMKLDIVTLEVIRNVLPAITNEMSYVLQRTSYNMMIYEVRDYCCGLLDQSGRLLAQNTGGVSHFVADLGVVIRDGVERYGPDVFRPGDVIITNHQRVGGQHLNNVLIYTPCFESGRLFGFAATRAHWMDVGGLSTGFGGASALDPWMEGLQLDQIKLYEAGQLDEKTWRLIREQHPAFPNPPWAI